MPNLLPKTKNNTFEDSIIKEVRNLVRLKRENNAIKDTVIRDIRTHFESEKEDYYEPVILLTFLVKIKLKKISINN